MELPRRFRFVSSTFPRGDSKLTSCLLFTARRYLLLIETVLLAQGTHFLGTAESTSWCSLPFPLLSLSPSLSRVLHFRPPPSSRLSFLTYLCHTPLLPSVPPRRSSHPGLFPISLLSFRRRTHLLLTFELTRTPFPTT